MTPSSPAGMDGQLREISQVRRKDVALSFFGTRWTYGELLDRIARTADALSALGLKPEMRAAVALPNTPEAVYLIYALSRIGATPVLLHPMSTATEVADILARADCRCAFCLPGDADKYAGVPDLPLVSVSPVQSANPVVRLVFAMRERKTESDLSRNAVGRRGVMTWSRFIQNGRKRPPERNVPAGRDEDVALILGSGGTGGQPKHILLSNRAVATLAVFSQSLNRSRGNDGLLCLMPFFHGFGLCFALHAGLLAGKKCILMPGYSDRDFARTIRREKPAYLVGVPAMYERLASNPYLRDSRLDFILGAACGGDTMGERAFREVCDFLARRGCRCGIQIGYGLTECVTACTFTPENSFKPGRIGKPFPGMRLKIAADVRSSFPPETPGEIWVSGPTLMSGYLGDPAATAEALPRDDEGTTWLRTGDIGLLDAEGHFRFLEREKRVIKRAGYNVFPGMVEAALETHPEVLQAHVVRKPAVESASSGSETDLVAFVRTKSASENLESELLACCARELNPFHQPSRIVLLEKWPLTRMKKVDLPALEKMAAAL